jgi:uridine phosphorylase
MDFFDPEPEGVVKARDMVKLFTARRGVKEEELTLPARAVITFSRRILKDLVQVAGADRLDSWHARHASLFVAKIAGSAVALTLSAHGAPAAVILLEELIAFGVNSALFVGYCGSIQEGIALGEVILPSCAIREDGTSYHYLPKVAECRADRVFLERVDRSLQRRGVPTKRGSIWTTDAFYMETKEKIEKYRAAGALAVDMEMAALFAVGAVRRIRVAGLLLVSDQFSGSAWIPGFFDPLLLERERFIDRVIVEWIKEEPY